MTKQAPKWLTEQATLYSVHSVWNRVSVLWETLRSTNENCKC